MNLIDDDRWRSYEVTGTYLEEKAKWLGAERNLHSGSRRFFEDSASLVSFSRFHYPLASVAFFHAIPGLERALKLHYKDEESSLSHLLRNAVSEHLINDSLFAPRTPFTKEFDRMVDREVGHKHDTYSDMLPVLIPALRNQYFHGTYLLAPDYLHLTFQLREIADALTTRHSR